MLLATGLLFVIILNKGGGMENIMKKVLETNPSLLTPDGGGAVSKPFILSFWMLVGIGVLGLPVTEVRCMGFKDSKAMHKSYDNRNFICRSAYAWNASGSSDGNSCRARS